MRRDQNSRTHRHTATVIAAGCFGLVMIALGVMSSAGTQRMPSPPSGGSQLPTALVSAKLDCAALAEAGGRRDPRIPDFQEIPEAPTRITSARIVLAANGQPEYCEVNGYVQTQVKFQLKLPTKTWNGRYLQFGCSGYCGMIPRTTFPANRAELGGDFALGATNTGHDTAQVTDTLWAGGNEHARIDYGYRGVHVVAVAAKAIQAAYYGRPPVRSYWTGCSCGGREGLMEAQRYPRDFDGIVAGAPASLQTFNPILHGLGPAYKHGWKRSDYPDG